VIRPLAADDAAELAALLAANRDFLAPFEPDRPDSFYTVDGQRERLSRPREDSWLFGIVDDDALAGTISLANVASQRVLEKNGFERIGVARRYLHIAGAWRDHVLFQRVAD
jgi:ribosomal-protein-alanine N-acetyltransferase